MESVPLFSSFLTAVQNIPMLILQMKRSDNSIFKFIVWTKGRFLYSCMLRFKWLIRNQEREGGGCYIPYMPPVFVCVFTDFTTCFHYDIHAAQKEYAQSNIIYLLILPMVTCSFQLHKELCLQNMLLFLSNFSL